MEPEQLHIWLELILGQLENSHLASKEEHFHYLQIIIFLKINEKQDILSPP